MLEEALSDARHLPAGASRCKQCRHERPYDENLTKIRMCEALVKGGGQRHTCNFMRATYGQCGPEAVMFEAANG